MPTSSPPTGRRSERKRQQILDAAFELFLADGFAATALEQVAEAAGVSRQTVYAHFGDTGLGVKEALFVAMVEARVGGDAAPLHPLVAAMPHTDHLRRDLSEYARHHLRAVLDPELVRLRRIILGEAERFPMLARTWFDSGPQRSFDLFASWFAALHRRGLLRAPDPLLAGQTFNWLVLSTPLNDAMADPGGRTALDLDRYADEAVRVFLAAYGAGTSGSS